MYRIAEGSTQGLPDLEEFVRMLDTMDRHPQREARELFDPHAPIVVARAPGRLDLMGGIADYSGALVLELPIREATLVALQRDSARRVRIVSLDAERNRRAADFEMPLDDFEEQGRPVEYAWARRYFHRDPARHWAAYVTGAFLVLLRERGVAFSEGARILIASDVPEGKGVSSSAALEVAMMQALVAAFGITLAPKELARLCQMVENLVVGAPCGIMDQMTAACGERDRLLALRCQPAQLEGLVPLPEELGVWGIDSGVRHTISGSDYHSVRVGAFMGYRIIAEQVGLAVELDERGESVRVVDPLWNGYLANIAPSAFEQSFAAILPERITGHEFLARYGGTTDAVTRVRPESSYPVRAPAAHPIYENFRVQAFAELLTAELNERRRRLLGELMYQSHASYSACSLGSRETDRLVELVRQAGPAQGFYGAKITGGGSGGTVAVLGRRDARSALQALADQYARETGYAPLIFDGSSPGAAQVSPIKLMTSP